MTQPDRQLFQPVMRLRGVILAIMLVAYTWAWLADTSSTPFAVMAGILATEVVLSGALYLVLSPRRDGLLVHICLLIDTLATTGLIMCSGYTGSYFQLFFVLIVVAAGLLFGQAAGVYYLACISLANGVALVLSEKYPLIEHGGRSADVPYAITVLSYVALPALPLIAFQLLLVVKLTQRGRYLGALYDNVSDGLFILDETGTIVDVNGLAAEMTGFGQHELIGRTLESLAVAPEGEWVAQQFHRCLAGQPISFELALARKNGNPLPVEVSAQHVAGLSPTRVQAFARDVTARRLMEEEIRRQNAELRRINQELQVGRDLALNASRLKSQFLANISHELRTPLNSILGYTQFVLDDRQRPLADDQREDLRRVLHAGRQLLDLINGLLDLARIESGRESVSISRFALGDLADSVIDAVMPMAKDKGLGLTCQAERGLPELQSDEKKLRQILLNLLANAVKFTERGSVSVVCERAETDFVRISVSDTGIGIPADHLNAIFNEFHQVDPAIHKQYGGTGLGLAIAKRLVELLKGTIQVESTPAAGSTFVVSIPITLSLAHDAAGSTTVVPVRAKPQHQAAGPVDARAVDAGPAVAQPVATDS